MLNQNASLDRMFHALGDASRRAMLARLCLGPATVSDLAAPLAMTLPSVMQHLQVLEASGLVRSAKTGRTRTCTLEAAALARAEDWLAARRQLWERRLDRLGALLDATEPDPGDPT
jgi:DNA-binding transcriptional ArsR family regulator